MFNIVGMKTSTSVYTIKKEGTCISTYTKEALTGIFIIAILLAVFPLLKFHYGRQISFSKEPGYYDCAFYLTISGGGHNTIHFTLDGSEPTMDDPVYDRRHPIYIDDASNHENVYSARTDTSTGFLTDLINQYSVNPPGYTVPAYKVDKCNIVRASVFDAKGRCLSSITGTYFVGFQEKKGYQNIYTASLVTAPENLFDEDMGIYVTGNKFRQFWQNDFGKNITGIDAYWWWWHSNYSNRGFAWERDAHITLFDNFQNVVLAENCGIRIKGGGSRGQLPKSISCYARNIYEGYDHFQADLFHNNIFPHKFVLFSGGDDNRFKLKDYFANVMEQDLNFATMDFIPCAVFLDGEYWGMYYLTEDYNADYIHNHYHVADSNVILIKNGGLAEGNDTDFLKYEEMIAFINEQDMAESVNYIQASNLIDMDSYIDYYAAQIYIARCGDWPSSNYALWRTKENDGSFYGDGKWRFMLFDVNSGGLSAAYLSEDTLSYVLASDSTFASLYRNETFRRQFAKQLVYIGREVFAPEKCDSFLDQYAQTLKEPVSAGNMRFYMDEMSDEFDARVADLKTFFNERYDVVWGFLEDNLGKEWLSANGIQK